MTISAPIVTKERSHRRIYAWALILLILVAWAFRFPPIPFPPVGVDEGATADFVFGHDIVYLATHYNSNDHVFYSLMTRVAHEVWGTVPLSIRLPALLAGILGLPALFILGRRLFGERVGLLAALLLFFSNRHWHYSLQGRGYTTVILAVILSFYFFWRGWQSNRRRDWLGFILATVAAPYTHLSPSSRWVALPKVCR